MIDTSPEAEAVFLDQARRASTAAKVGVGLDLIATAHTLMASGIRQRWAGISPEEQVMRLGELCYGTWPPSGAPPGLIGCAQGQNGMVRKVATPLDALLDVVTALEDLGVSYLLGGSWASTAYGLPRYTNDADLLAALTADHVEPLVRRLESAYYVSVEAVREAIERPDHASFNIIPLDMVFKIDVFVLKTRSYDAAQMARRRPHVIRATPERTAFLAGPEDTVLTKLDWYRQGGETSERQWNDVLGVLKVQGAGLDGAYLEHWAGVLGVTDLLARARREAEPPARP